MPSLGVSTSVCRLDQSFFTRFRFVFIPSLLLILVSHGWSNRAAFSADSADRPNIMFILADDLGWRDVAFHGGNVPTPHLDRLRTESAELTQHYVYPVCSPTRSALLSGRYASRFGVTSPQNQRAYPWNTVTLPRALKVAGYDTALCGKWHLGSKPEWGPQKYGFDHSYGSLAGGVGPWNHRYKKGEFSVTWHRNGELIKERGHVTDLIAREAIAWLNARGDRPFFLYVPFTAVHIPIHEPESLVRNVSPEITEPSHREYAACIAHLDETVGKLLEALEATGKANNTLVVFTSDNGGISTARNDDPSYPEDYYTPGRSKGNNKPLRGQKGSVYEGGTRVVTLARWPGKLKPGRFDTPVHVSDWMPTFCALAGYTPTEDLRWDGRNIWPALSGASELDAPTIYVAGPGFRSASLRHGDWKLVVSTPAGFSDGPPHPQAVELFHLPSDPCETEDRASSLPARVAEMQRKLAEAVKTDRDAVAND